MMDKQQQRSLVELFRIKLYPHLLSLAISLSFPLINFVRKMREL